MSCATTIWREVSASRSTLINTFGGGVGGGNQAYSDEDFAKDTQLQLKALD